MEPHSVCDRILREHDRLRDLIAELDAVRKGFESGEVADAGALFEAATVLFEVFAAHLQLEDATLVPALRALGAEREAAAERLLREHAEQRATLRFLMQRLEASTGPTSLLAGELRQFSDSLRADMAHEEAAILRDGLLGVR